MAISTFTTSYLSTEAPHYALSYASYVDSLIDNSSTSYGTLCTQHCSEYHFDQVAQQGFDAWLSFWCKAIIRKIFLRYLYHPVYLFLLPLGCGIVLGLLLARLTCRYSYSSNATNTDLQRKQQAGTNHPHYLTTTCQSWKSYIGSIVIPLVLLANIAAHKKVEFNLKDKEDAARAQAKNKTVGDKCYEAQVPQDKLPKHIAVIMDGNRRYGRSKYGIATKVRIVRDC